MIYINGSNSSSYTGVTYVGAYVTITVQTTDSTGSLGLNSIVSDKAWATIQLVSSTTQGNDTIETYKISFTKNDSEEQRGAIITMEYEDDNGDEWANTFTIYQGGHIDTLIPVWKDYYYRQNVENLEYCIMKGETEIYRAKATMNPVAMDGIKVNVSKIVQDYLSQLIPIDIREIETSSGFTSDNATADFTLYAVDIPVLTYHYINDWSYDNNTMDVDESYILSMPINGHADNRMLLPLTYKLSQGTDDRDYIVNGIGDLYTWDKPGKVSTLIYNASAVVAMEGTQKYLSDEDGYARYDIKYCGDYALYYRNRKGGYDAFLVEGRSKKIDSFNKYTYGKIYDNTSLDFEKSTYNLQITAQYELNTGWLTDEQSQILAHNLISSNEVYLHNLNDGQIMPVIMSNTSVEYKTFKNQGRQMAKYDITCEESQTKQIL